MDTLTVALAETWPVLFGSSSFSAFGLISVDVTRKKIRSRNTMSVIDDIEKPESTFVVLLIAMSLFCCRFMEHIDKLDSSILHLEHEVRNL